MVVALLGWTVASSAASANDIIPIFNLGSQSAPACVGTCGTVNQTLADVIGNTTPLSPLYGFLSTSGGVAGAASLAELKQNVLETTGSTLVSQSFQAQAGDNLSISFNYITSDGTNGFGDYAWARVLSNNQTVAWLFTAKSTTQGPDLTTASIVDNKAKLPAPGNGVVVTTLSAPTGGEPVWAPLGAFSGRCFSSANCGSTGWLQSTFAFTSSGTYTLQFGVTNVGDTNNLTFDSGLAYKFAGMTSPNPEPASYALMGAALVLIGFNATRRRKRPRE